MHGDSHAGQEMRPLGPARAPAPSWVYTVVGLIALLAAFDVIGTGLGIFGLGAGFYPPLPASAPGVHRPVRQHGPFSDQVLPLPDWLPWPQLVVAVARAFIAAFLMVAAMHVFSGKQSGVRFIRGMVPIAAITEICGAGLWLIVYRKAYDLSNNPGDPFATVPASGVAVSANWITNTMFTISVLALTLTAVKLCLYTCCFFSLKAPHILASFEQD